MRGVLVAVLLAILAAGPVRAESSAADKPPTAQAVNPHIGEMNEKAKALASVLTKREAKDLGHIRDNFGVLRSIGLVRESVGNAVSLCADKNPDLSEPIKSKHEKWLADVGGQLGEQEKSLETALGGNRFKDEKQVRDYLETLDRAAAYADSHMDKTVVTTPEACTKLMDSMDETRGVLLGLLKDMTWPSAVVPDEGGEKNP